MKQIRFVVMMFAAAGIFLSNNFQAINGTTKVTVYSGMCDGSAASAIDEKRFVAASDEISSVGSTNVLGIYSNEDGRQIGQLNLSKTLQSDKEADIEGSARIGNRIFWISSHGHNKNGKQRPERLNLFATDLENDNLVLAHNAQPFPAYHKLLDDMIADARYAPFGLKALNEGALSPEAGGINIEGLSATPDNKLILAFRSPVVGGKALLAPLENGNDLVEGKAVKALFGAPVVLDLGGLGIRDIAYSNKKNVYLIIAGAVDDSGKFSLFEWNGKSEKPKKVENVDFTGFNPETIFIYPESGRTQILSDDGSIKNADGVENKDLPDAKRSFRGIWLIPVCDWSLEN